MRELKKTLNNGKLAKYLDKKGISHKLTSSAYHKAEDLEKVKSRRTYNRKLGNIFSLCRRGERDTAALLKILERQIEVEDVVIYTCSHCQTCNDVKCFLKANNIWAEIVPLDKWRNGKGFFKELEKISGTDKCPQVFIGGEFFGNDQDLRFGAKSGVLAKALDKAAIPHALVDTTFDLDDVVDSGIQGTLESKYAGKFDRSMGMVASKFKSASPAR